MSEVLMSELGDKLWQRNTEVWRLIYDAKKRFKERRKTDIVAAHTELASVFYSLAGQFPNRYGSLMMRFLMLCALRNADKAYQLSGFHMLSAEKIDVLTSIWMRVPSWVPHYRELAKQGFTCALSPDRVFADNMIPHTEPLLRCNYALLLWKEGATGMAWREISLAESALEAVEQEKDKLREKQLSRIHAKLGFFLFDHAGSNDARRKLAEEHLIKARALALEHSVDRFEKLNRECLKRGIKL